MVRAITTRLRSVGKVAMMINISDPRDHADATWGAPSQIIVRSGLDNGWRLILISRDGLVAGAHDLRLDNTAAAQLAFAALVQTGYRLATEDGARRQPSQIAILPKMVRRSSVRI